MIATAAGPGHDVDDCTRALPILGAVVTGLNAELLESVGKWEGSIRHRVLVHVVAAVQQVIRLVRPRAIGGDRYGSRERLRVSFVRAIAWRRNYACHQSGQGCGIPAVECWSKYRAIGAGIVSASGYSFVGGVVRRGDGAVHVSRVEV